MKKCIIALLFFHFWIFTLAQAQPQWGLRLGFSSSEDKVGFGASFYPKESKMFGHFEFYPIQNRGSEITKEAKNTGFLLRFNYKLNDIDKKLNFTIGSELYYSRYSRIIVGTPNNIPTKSKSIQLMATAGLNWRIGSRVNVDVALPIVGLALENNDGVRNNIPVFLGFFGFFAPKAGVQLGLF